MKALANYCNREWRMVRFIWLLIVVLQISCLTAWAEKNRALPDAIKTKQKTKKDQQDTISVKSINDSSKSSLPLPSEEMLEAVLSNTKSFRVIDCGLDADGKLRPAYSDLLREESSGRIIFESSESLVLRDLRNCLRIAKGSQFSESSGNFPLGSTTFELTLADGRKVNLGLVGTRLRWNAWRQDAYLLHPVALIAWLGEHGAMRPLREIEARFDYAKHIYKRDVVGFEEFVREMPKSLSDFFGTIKRLESSMCLEDMSKNYGAIPKSNRLKLARSALSRQFPNESDQIGVLLEWDGKISSVRNSYQRFPIELLLEYSPDKVLSKVKKSPLSKSQWVGVMRYYSDLDFRRKFPSGCSPLDRATRDRIVKNVKATGQYQLDIDEFEEAMRNLIR